MHRMMAVWVRKQGGAHPIWAEICLRKQKTHGDVLYYLAIASRRMLTGMFEFGERVCHSLGCNAF